VSPALYLIDTSGLFRILQDKLRQAWSDQLTAGVIVICPIVELEFLYSARSLADRLEKRRLLRELFGWVPMPERAYERADEIQQRLTETGRHRSAGPVDLLIAATAESERLIVLCDDRDFEVVASVTGQPVKLVTAARPRCRLGPCLIARPSGLRVPSSRVPAAP
jgi:predicted nucleic acid-binding protein